VPDVFEELRRRVPFRELASHEETGNALTYARDRRVAAWAREHGVAWREFPQNGWCGGCGPGCVIGRDYPFPVVDPVTAPREAKDRIFARRRERATRAEADRIQIRHGSRRRSEGDWR